MGHYYQQCDDGKVIPMHYVEMTSRPGELRPTRISDVRKWWKEGRQVVPSVTTILNVLDKPALVNWKVDQHLAQAWAMQTDHWDEETKWIAEVKRLTEIQLDIAPSAGTDVHKLLELFYSGQPIPIADTAMCDGVDKVIIDRTCADKWQPERNFVSDGFGGQVDLSGNGWLIDFKSKQSADKFKPGKMAYDDHRMQLAAYRMGLNMPTARCSNVFICLENGEVDFHEHTEAELDKGWKLFQHCLAIWQLQNGA